MTNWKQYLNIYTLGGAAAGGYVGHTKYGKKHGYTAPVAGAVGGAVMGLLLQKILGGNQAPPPQQQVAQGPAKQQQAFPQGNEQGDFVDLSDLNPTERAQVEIEQIAHENLGSLSGTDGLGSLSGTPGFDADTIDYDEILGEDGGGDFN